MEKLKAFVNANLLTAQVFLALSLVQLGYTIALALVVNKNLGLLASLLSTLIAAPKNVIAAITIKKFFLK